MDLSLYFSGKHIREGAMLLVFLLLFALTGGIFIFNSNTTGKLKPLTFNIIDSPMGIGKSLSLMEFIRFHPRGKGSGATRFIVFVPTIKERDERFAKELGFTCLAEGAEMREQVDRLRGLGCEIIQGYYYSKPIPMEEYETTYLS